MDTGNKGAENESMPRNNDYLWDGSGEPDPEIQKLEKLLGKFRHDHPVPVFPEIAPARRWALFPWRLRLFPAVASATALVAIAAATFLLQGKKPVPITAAGWDVSRLAGTPRIGRNTVSGRETSRLGVGQVLETDQQSRASLRAEDTGQIEVEQCSRLRLMTMGADLNRIALDRGTIQVYIWAPPGQFVVDLEGGRIRRGDGAHVARLGRFQVERPRVFYSRGRGLCDTTESRPRHTILRGCVADISRCFG